MVWRGVLGRCHPWNTPKGDTGGCQGPCARCSPGLRLRHPRRRRLRSLRRMWRIQQPLPAPACTGKSGNPALLPNPSVSKAPRASALLLSLHGTARAWLLLQGKKTTEPSPCDPHQAQLQGQAAPPAQLLQGRGLTGGSKLLPRLKAGSRLQLGWAFGSCKFSVCLSHDGREGTETLPQCCWEAALVPRG